MHVLQVRNVAQALPQGLHYLLRHGVREDSRAGPVLVAPCPVTTVYQRPRERVLFSAVRDANPFFHLVESLWMLAGRDDAALLNKFVADFGPRFADDDVVHGAYGHRWRRALGFDQLDAVVAKLRANPQDRQCVLQMWDARARDFPPDDMSTEEHSAAEGRDDLRGDWKDRPCNTHAYLRVRSVLPPTTDDNSADHEMKVALGLDKVLDITVCCRSNDAIWGAYGANAVHFSVLQEYLAARVGVGVGTYYQVSNNFHAYEDEIKRLRTRSGVLQHQFPEVMDRDDYGTNCAAPLALVEDPDTFDLELAGLLARYEAGTLSLGALQPALNTFLSGTVAPMLAAHAAYKNKQLALCYACLQAVCARDWRTAATEWIDRRRNK